jgi:hypothetical protein
MQDNRWCENCGSDRGTKNVSWYLATDFDCEMSFCKKCANLIGQEMELELIAD